MKLVLLSPSGKKETEIPQLLHMFEQGLPLYHVRKAKYSTAELKKYIEEIPEKYHNRLVIHAHHELVKKYNLRGIYLSRTHKRRKLRTWLRIWWLKRSRPDLEVSTTVRSIESLFDTGIPYNYQFLAPVFDSLSGNYQAAFKEQNLKNLLEKNRFEVIARGGVTYNKIAKAAEIGLAGVAFSSAIWKTTNPVRAFMEVKETFEELDIPME